MDVQHVNVKIFCKSAPSDLGAVLPVFHGWIQRKALPGMLIDVADYRHVPDGPGVILVGHEAIYSLDQREGRLGLLYNQRTATDGSASQKMHQAYEAARRAAELLEAETDLRFDWSHCEVSINDRLLAPNNEKTRRELTPGVEEFARGLFGRGAVEISFHGEPRQTIRIAVRAAA